MQEFSVWPSGGSIVHADTRRTGIPCDAASNAL